MFMTSSANDGGSLRVAYRKDTSMKTMRYVLVGAMCVVSGGLILAGCAVESGEEAVGEAQSAFGEAACGTDTTEFDHQFASTGWSCGEFSTTFTSGTTYGHTDCAHGFICDFQHPQSGLGAYANWADTLPTTQTACNNSIILLDTYDHAGTQIGSQVAIGGTWGGTSCSFATASNGLLGSSSAWGRAVAQAFTCSDNIFSCTTRTYHKVSVFAFYPTC
jgi:hypothetical protein